MFCEEYIVICIYINDRLQLYFNFLKMVLALMLIFFIKCELAMGSMVGLMATSRGLMPRGTFQDRCCQAPVPVTSRCQPAPPQEAPQHWQAHTHSTSLRTRSPWPFPQGLWEGPRGSGLSGGFLAELFWCFLQPVSHGVTGRRSR